MTTRTPARSQPLATPELDDEIRAAEAQAVVVWRGERIPFPALRERIGRVVTRAERDGLYASYIEAVEALNPHYERRLAAWKQVGDVVAEVRRRGTDPVTLAEQLERFSLLSETQYYAALRRFLALIGIEQGDATEADLWHVVRGTAWGNWFGERDVAAAIAGTGRPDADAADLDGWRAAERRLAGDPIGSDATVAAATGEAYATLVGSPEWLAEELGMDAESVSSFVDFAAFVRVWRIRRLVAELHYELRLFTSDEPAIQRAYYAGIVGHTTGVAVAEEGYLTGLEAPFASARKLESALLAGMLVDTLEQRHGLRWWREPTSAQLVEKVRNASSRDDALAELGYDALDWRPVLRQIRTRLIGEMSGYGGPNITTRAGTRKV
jgi:hypothetical protein